MSKISYFLSLLCLLFLFSGCNKNTAASRDIRDPSNYCEAVSQDGVRLMERNATDDPREFPSIRVTLREPVTPDLSKIEGQGTYTASTESGCLVIERENVPSFPAGHMSLSDEELFDKAMGQLSALGLPVDEENYSMLIRERKGMTETSDEKDLVEKSIEKYQTNKNRELMGETAGCGASLSCDHQGLVRLTYAWADVEETGDNPTSFVTDGIDDDYIRYVSQILGEGETVTCYVSYAYVEQDGRYFQAKVYSEDTSLGNAYCADLTTGESLM